MVAPTTAQATTTVNAAACCSRLSNPHTVDGEIFLGLAYSSLLLLFLFYFSPSLSTFMHSGFKDAFKLLAKATVLYHNSLVKDFELNL